jgi:aspartyl aminopeptidase
MSLVEKACKFITASTDPFHAVITAIRRLESAGFVRWTANDALTHGGKYYYTVHNSTFVAFVVGSQLTETPGFLIVGGHTDSPNLRVKPASKVVPAKFNTVQLGVECYGGGLWHTWFDRDLGISGKVLVREQQQRPNGGHESMMMIVPKLVQINDPVARVSTLCIHLQSDEERRAFAVNKQDHTVPIIGQPAKPTEKNAELEAAVLEQIQGSGSNSDKDDKSSNNSSWQRGHEPLLLQRIAQELNIAVADICDFDLSLFDTQPAAVGGLNGEFLYSARLDNLATVFCATEALAQHDPTTSADICMTVGFDHEEVGSVSANGAGSPVLAEAVRRVAEALQLDRAKCAERSFCLSIDQAHAVHPNYANKHESQHQPIMNAGVVVKSNANQRYASNSATAFVVRELGRRLDIPIQEFCGTYVGSVVAAVVVVKT